MMFATANSRELKHRLERYKIYLISKLHNCSNAKDFTWTTCGDIGSNFYYDQ